MKDVFYLKVDDKIIGTYTRKVQAHCAADAYFEHYGVMPLVVATKVVGFATR